MAALVGDGAAGVVLVGGRSSRMGMAKAELEWHGSTLLRRTLGVLARSVEGPLLVVRSPGQPLPEIPPHVEVVDDPEQGRDRCRASPSVWLRWPAGRTWRSSAPPTYRSFIRRSSGGS